MRFNSTFMYMLYSMYDFINNIDNMGNIFCAEKMLIRSMGVFEPQTALGVRRWRLTMQYRRDISSHRASLRSIIQPLESPALPSALRAS